MKKIERLPLIIEYESFGKKYVEHSFISYVLNEENVDYKWCGMHEFVNYCDKNNLAEIFIFCDCSY